MFYFVCELHEPGWVIVKLSEFINLLNRRARYLCLSCPTIRCICWVCLKSFVFDNLTIHIHEELLIILEMMSRPKCDLINVVQFNLISWRMVHVIIFEICETSRHDDRKRKSGRWLAKRHESKQCCHTLCHFVLDVWRLPYLVEQRMRVTYAMLVTDRSH